MAVGLDGNVWFTGGEFNYGTDIITRIYANGSDDQIQRARKQGGQHRGGPRRQHVVLVIKTGEADKIGKMTTSGTVTEYSLPSRKRCRTASRPAPTATSGSPTTTATRSCSMTTSGSITGEYSLPAGSGPTGIMAGPDGKLWFTSEKSQKDRQDHDRRHDHRIPACRPKPPWAQHRHRPRRKPLVHHVRLNGKVGKITTSGTSPRCTRCRKATSRA